MLSKQFLRFCLVGVANTLTDLTIYVLLRQAGLPIVIANIISTSVGLAVSLLLNYNYTFQSKSLTRARIGLYILVTLVGLWALQPIVITAITAINNHLHLTHIVSNITGHDNLLSTIFAKLCATAVTLIWNYVWYSRVIFKQTVK